MPSPSRALARAIRAASIASMPALVAGIAPVAAHADENAVREYAIPAGNLETALNRFGREAGILLSYPTELTANRNSPGLRGRYTVAQALTQLLSGSGVQAVRTGDGNYTLQPAPAGSAVTLKTMQIKADAAPLYVDAPETHGFKADYQTSATRTPLALKETPQSISVVTQSSLRARQVQTLETAIELTPNVAYAGVPNPGAFAGQGPRHYGNGFVLRNQELIGDRDIRTDGFSTSNVSVIDLAAYERIDVVRGPSGLYGQGSLGGFINQIRRKPQPQFEASIAASAGSFDTYRVEGDITGPLSNDGSASGRLTLARDDAGSFVDHVHTERTFVAPSVDVLFGERTRALLQFLYQNEKFSPNPGFPTRLVGDEIKAPEIADSLYVGVPNARDDTAETLETSLRIDHELSDKWLASVFLQDSHLKRKAGFDSYAYGMADNGDTYMYTQRNTVDQDRWAGEMRIDGSFDAFGLEHHVTAGVERNRRDGNRRQGYAYVGVANLYEENFAAAGSVAELDVWRTDRSYIIDNTALYAQTLLSLSERVKLLLGARQDWAKQRGDTYYQGEPEPMQNYAQDELTWRAGLTWELSRNINTYITYGESFNPISAQARGGRLLDPETGEGYEVGVKTEWFDGRFASNLALYRQDLDGRALRDPDNGPGESFYISLGPHRADGAELEMSGSPLAGMTLGGSVSVSDNEFTDRADTYYDLSMHGSIDKQHSLFASYEWQRGALRGFSAGTTWVHVGERQYLLGNRQIYADGYDRVDLNFSYKGIRDVEFDMLVRNVTDEEYLEATGYTGIGSYFGSPRAVLVSVKKSFN